MCRQMSISGDGLAEGQGGKESSSLLTLHKLRTSHSERELPNLIPSHPEGGEGLTISTLPLTSSLLPDIHMYQFQANIMPKAACVTTYFVYSACWMSHLGSS